MLRGDLLNIDKLLRSSADVTNAPFPCWYVDLALHARRLRFTCGLIICSYSISSCTAASIATTDIGTDRPVCLLRLLDLDIALLLVLCLVFTALPLACGLLDAVSAGTAVDTLLHADSVGVPPGLLCLRWYWDTEELSEAQLKAIFGSVLLEERLVEGGDGDVAAHFILVATHV